MKKLFTLGEKIWLVITVLFLFSVMMLNNVSIITLTITYILTYIFVIGITMLILNK
jgi:hypothetical protein